jgi:DNA-binding transcriptional ArsR family regulator
MEIIPHNLHHLLQQLDAVRQLKDGSWLARCPAHDDSKPSLHITLGEDRILLHCFAGCSTDSILRALGIHTADLFLRDGHPESSQDGLTLATFARAKALRKDLLQAWGVHQSLWQNKPAVAFRYTDADGDLQAVRLRTALTGDRFRWQNGAKPKELLYGAWWVPLWREKGIPRVMLVEGESDCLALWQAGVPAVGVPGADCLSPENAKLLDGFEVVLWREPDAGGEKMLQSAAERLGDRLRVMDPPHGAKDASDLWLRVWREEMQVTEVTEPIYMPSHPSQKSEAWERARERFKVLIRQMMEEAVHVTEVTEATEPIYMPSHPSHASVVDLGAVPEPPPQEWLVKDLIPARFITNLYADSGQGKSFLILHLALCCLTGEPFCGKRVKAGKVLYLDWELDVDTTARRWYAVCRGAGFPSALRGLLYERMTKPMTAVYPYILSLVEQHAPVLLVVDSLGKALGTDPRDPEKAIQAYHLMEQLPCAVLVVDHQSKLQTEDTYANKTEYGTAYKAHYARSRLQIERTGDSETSAGSRVGIVIRHKKSNFGALHPDMHLFMTFTNDGEGNLQTVCFEQVQDIGADAEALGARGEILTALREGDRTVEELEELTGLSRTAISDHIHALRRAGLVAQKGRKGRAKVWGLASDGSDGIYIGSVTSVTSEQAPEDPLLLELEVTADDGD